MRFHNLNFFAVAICSLLLLILLLPIPSESWKEKTRSKRYTIESSKNKKPKKFDADIHNIVFFMLSTMFLQIHKKNESSMKMFSSSIYTPYFKSIFSPTFILDTIKRNPVMEFFLCSQRTLKCITIRILFTHIDIFHRFLVFLSFDVNNRKEKKFFSFFFISFRFGKCVKQSTNMTPETMFWQSRRNGCFWLCWQSIYIFFKCSAK